MKHHKSSAPLPQGQLTEAVDYLCDNICTHVVLWWSLTHCNMDTDINCLLPSRPLMDHKWSTPVCSRAAPKFTSSVHAVTSPWLCHVSNQALPYSPLYQLRTQTLNSSSPITSSSIHPSALASQTKRSLHLWPRFICLSVQTFLPHICLFLCHLPPTL